uniref:CSON000472 protein n=1 Tax=Culicoides sonorensis TaxID=179676 RepID=A0A336K412_CULSO
MKLWKTRKSTSCVSGNSKINEQKKQQDVSKAKSITTQSTPVLGSRAMSPAQSEDSGLAVDRPTTYTSITIPREDAKNLAITFAERFDLSCPPLIESINELGTASDMLSPGDRIHQIDGISTIGLSNQHVFNLLCNGDGPATVEIEYYLPEHVSQNKLRVISKIAQITIERETDFLGLTLRGGGDLPLIVTNVRPEGPVYKTGLIKPGDRILRLDNISLIHKTLAEAQQLLKTFDASRFSNLTIEYDVSVIQNLEFSVGPLLIEIERSANERVGLVLSNYSNVFENQYQSVDDIKSNQIYIANIIPASIADRCGAFSVGDKLISVNGTIIDGLSYSPSEAMELIDASSSLGYLQLQIMPIHAIARRREMQLSQTLYGYNTVDSRKTVRSRSNFSRKTNYQSQIYDPMEIYANSGLYRSELVHTIIDCSQGSGICLGPPAPNGRGLIISHVIRDSAADRSGCIQKGDRLLAVNKIYNLDLITTRQMLGDYPSEEISTQCNSWVELEIEYDIADCTSQKCGIFDVKLIKRGKSGLGITVNGSSSGMYAISHIKPGSPAYRTGALRPGDIVIAVDSHPVEHFNIDLLLKETQSDCVTLTIRRNTLPDFLFDAQQKNNFMFDNSENSYNSSPKFGEILQQRSPSPVCQELYEMIELNKMNLNPPPPQEWLQEGQNEDIEHYKVTPKTNLSQSIKTEKIEQNFVVKLEKNHGPLGITLAGSEQAGQPITISAIADGGLAQKTGEIDIGDQLLAVNGQNVQNMALSDATKLLHKFNDVVYLQLSRIKDIEIPSHIPQPQAIYAKVVKKTSKSPSINDNISTSSDGFRTIHVVLHKDTIYDDYGFSVSDGLYEKGVYINRIRSGGPADLTGQLKPFDRIIQVNDTKTLDFDCCLTVPLIATAGDKIDLIVQRATKVSY